jgi:hypothetical protein
MQLSAEVYRSAVSGADWPIRETKDRSLIYDVQLWRMTASVRREFSPFKPLRRWILLTAVRNEWRWCAVCWQLDMLLGSCENCCGQVADRCGELLRAHCSIVYMAGSNSRANGDYSMKQCTDFIRVGRRAQTSLRYDVRAQTLSRYDVGDRLH